MVCYFVSGVFFFFFFDKVWCVIVIRAETVCYSDPSRNGFHVYESFLVPSVFLSFLSCVLFYCSIHVEAIHNCLILVQTV